MEIEIIKAGLFAENGIYVTHLDTGVQEVNNDFATRLIKKGWAVLPSKAVENIKPDIEIELIQEEKATHEIESIVKGKAGWWLVKFTGIEDVIKVRGADDEKEAQTLAIAKLEVSE